MISGRSSDTTYEQTEYLKPGKISSVTAAPPSTWRRSSTSTFRPGARQVRRVDQAVVAAADDDDVVVHVCRYSMPDASRTPECDDEWLVARLAPGRGLARETGGAGLVLQQQRVQVGGRVHRAEASL